MYIMYIYIYVYTYAFVYTISLYKKQTYLDIHILYIFIYNWGISRYILCATEV